MNYEHRSKKKPSGGASRAWSTSNRRQRLPSNWSSLRSSILRRDKYRCQIQGSGCLIVATEVDHILRGDNHDPSNLRGVCSKCHREKTLTEAQEVRRKKRSMRFRPTERHPGSR